VARLRAVRVKQGRDEHVDPSPVVARCHGPRRRCPDGDAVTWNASRRRRFLWRWRWVVVAVFETTAGRRRRTARATPSDRLTTAISACADHARTTWRFRVWCRPETVAMWWWSLTTAKPLLRRSVSDPGSPGGIVDPFGAAVFHV